MTTFHRAGAAPPPPAPRCPPANHRSLPPSSIAPDHRRRRTPGGRGRPPGYFFCVVGVSQAHSPAPTRARIRPWAIAVYCAAGRRRRLRLTSSHVCCFPFYEGRCVRASVFVRWHGGEAFLVEGQFRCRRRSQKRKIETRNGVSTVCGDGGVVTMRGVSIHSCTFIFSSRSNCAGNWQAWRTEPSPRS